MATATPEKRKGILKDILNLSIYSKIEKTTKDKSNCLSKEIDKLKILLENIGNPEIELDELKSNLSKLDFLMNEKTQKLSNYNSIISDNNKILSELTESYSILDNKNSSLLSLQKTLLCEIKKLEESIKDYENKKIISSNEAKNVISTIKSLKEKKEEFSKIDLSILDKLSQQIILNKEEIARLSLTLQNETSKYDELNIPFPDDSKCKYCRQLLSNEHKEEFRNKLQLDKQICQKLIVDLKRKITSYNIENSSIIKKIDELNLIKSSLFNTDNQILNNEKQIQDKRKIYDEYILILNKYKSEFLDKKNQLESLKKEIDESSLDNLNKIKISIADYRQKNSIIESNIQLLNKEIINIISNKAIIDNNINKKNIDIKLKDDYFKNLIIQEEKYKIYPHVLQAFSSTGIPNLIIQNILDDLQIESNYLLNQLKPGLQLSFFVEKTKIDGSQDDTLDIKYFFNSKEREYNQLSGAMRLAVTFSLKIGLSFLLKKMMNTNLEFLLLDEVDQSLDKASIDAFYNIINFFQDHFMILVITHNDRLKDKFTNSILVEQDINSISSAFIINNNY